jgi:amino acid transporter
LLAVVVSAVFGYALAAGLTLAIHDLPAAQADDHAALFVLREALGARGGALGMGLALVAMWFCGLSSLTSASRTLYAFARDGGVPFSAKLSKVSERTRTPIAAIVTASLAALAFVLITSLLRDRVFALSVQVATMGLYVSYGVPIALGAWARTKGRLSRRGPFSLGKASVPIAFSATAWCVFVLLVCSLPPNSSAGLVLGALALTLVVVWNVRTKARFSGPKVSLADLERRS